MSAPTLLVCGHRLHILERIATVGAALGLERSSSYRCAEACAWPLVGPPTSRYVVVPSLMDSMGIVWTTLEEVHSECACAKKHSLERTSARDERGDGEAGAQG